MNVETREEALRGQAKIVYETNRPDLITSTSRRRDRLQRAEEGDDSR